MMTINDSSVAKEHEHPMNSTERMQAAIRMQPVDRIPNAPFYEAPICRYFGSSFREALLGGQAMVDAHLQAIDTYQFDWVMVGMGFIGGIIPEALGCYVTYPENEFPKIERTVVHSIDDIERIAGQQVNNKKMDQFLNGISMLKERLAGDVPIACEYISPFTIATRLRGTNEIMADFYQEPMLIQKLQEALVPIDIALGKALADAGVEYIFYGADMECPLLISPEHYRSFIHEPTSAVVNALAGQGAIVLPHMCGPIVKTGIVDMLLEMKVAGIMPGNITQDSVLSLKSLKEKVGDHVAIFDNLNPNGSLLTGTAEAVAEETKQHLEAARGWTGYLFSTAGTTSPNTPRENFDAMNHEVTHFPWEDAAV
jgi:uroporphyrinogen decarboxylase